MTGLPTEIATTPRHDGGRSALTQGKRATAAASARSRARARALAAQIIRERRVRDRRQAHGGAHRAHRAAGRGAPAHRGRSGRRQDDARQGAGALRRLHRVSRIQFTPDLLPSDITGVSVYNQADRRFEFKPGAVFANIVIGDEINRASPKTQSALLECMEERQVTVDGTTYPLASPFTVDRHAEPDRDGGHLRPSRGPARPVHGPHLDGLPGRRRPSWRCSTPRDTSNPLVDDRARS